MIKTLQIDCMCISLLLTACLVVGKNVSYLGISLHNSELDIYTCNLIVLILY